MRLFMVQLRGIEQTDRSYKYFSLIQRKEQSGHAIAKIFESEHEMLEIMDGILRRQADGEDRDIKRVLGKIQTEPGHQYFDLDLTEKEAMSLGWKGMNPSGHSLG